MQPFRKITCRPWVCNLQANHQFIVEHLLIRGKLTFTTADYCVHKTRPITSFGRPAIADHLSQSLLNGGSNGNQSSDRTTRDKHCPCFPVFSLLVLATVTLIHPLMTEIVLSLSTAFAPAFGFQVFSTWPCRLFCLPREDSARFPLSPHHMRATEPIVKGVPSFTDLFQQTETLVPQQTDPLAHNLHHILSL